MNTDVPLHPNITVSVALADYSPTYDTVSNSPQCSQWDRVCGGRHWRYDLGDHPGRRASAASMTRCYGGKGTRRQTGTHLLLLPHTL